MTPRLFQASWYPESTPTARSYEAIASARRPAWCRQTPRSFQSFGESVNSRTSASYSSSAAGSSRRRRCTSAIAWSVIRRSSPTSSASRYSRERFLVQALLPEGQAEVVVRECAALDDLRTLGMPAAAWVPFCG